ncbi:diacylglycerol glucosyltransferase [Paenibacillus darwinianus]|uniref:Diacylglycerol glucosyltransferase n=1 Tax=Paenibacillus darwinianus TaxID=1380763 RepID=A0A9W5W7W6_9BACL|nr:glycosyltransferase [Paenibacillus darwinianus]EXX89184.1 diacylglycerol glucosyltransferase [Paenibacillus darwinianus]EXX89467.1 diacylglycerol glucosyltransferase [Paenibacillus darwinianus]EXX89695.1 diacylglycerol glucosyltransferase [Paenibacillus darwinianus]
MSSKPKILILYAKFGDGHYQVSKALQQQFLDTGIYDVQLVDLFEEAHPLLNSISRFIYLKSNMYFPGFYGWSYNLTTDMKPDQFFGKWLHSFGMRTIKELLQKEKPDAVIHTFPFLAMNQFRQNTGNRTPSFTVITDYVLHNRWIHSETDRYFVATEELQQALLHKGVAKERISVTGIPLRSVFEKPMDNACIYQKYGLNRRKSYVLILAGAYGVLSGIDKMMRELIELDANLAFILITGKNRRLYDKFNALFSGYDNIHVLGYVEGIQQLMSVSSCIVTKAGAITLAEAMALNVPVIVYRPLPGQERGNAEYWAKQGTVGIVEEVAALKQAIMVQMKNGEKRARATQSMGRTPASVQIVEEVSERIQTKNMHARKIASH